MRDEWFIRGNVPMTKSEVRAVSISKLELTPEAVLYDIGAGTGSVSVEAAGQIPKGSIYAIERNPEAVELIRQNRERFCADQIRIVPGEASKVMGELPVASHAFLGGSGGEMEEILSRLLERNPSVRIVANVISLESLWEVLRLAKDHCLDAEVVCIQVAKAERAGSHHLMKGQNPVYVISMGGEQH